MCNVNIAAGDKEITPHSATRPMATFRPLCEVISLYLLFTEEIRGGGVASNCFTCDTLRRYLYYITDAEESDDKTAKARSQNARVETGRHPQPSPRLSLRHSLQRKSILRSQRSPSGSLRDAAPAQRGRGLDCRCGRHVWCFAPHCVSGPRSIPGSRPERPASPAPRTQRRSQAVHRGHRVRADSASSRTQIDDYRLCSSCSGEVQYHDSPPQSGAGPDKQKKTAQAVVRPPIPEGTVDAYEGLRRQVVKLNGQGEHAQGRGVFMRCGFATWAQINHKAVPAFASQSYSSSEAYAPVLDVFGAELVCLIAGLILSTRQEVSHA
jgi:hypothetical protein